MGETTQLQKETRLSVVDEKKLLEYMKGKVN